MRLALNIVVRNNIVSWSPLRDSWTCVYSYGVPVTNDFIPKIWGTDFFWWDQIPITPSSSTK